MVGARVRFGPAAAAKGANYFFPTIYNVADVIVFSRHRGATTAVELTCSIVYRVDVAMEVLRTRKRLFTC